MCNHRLIQGAGAPTPYEKGLTTAKLRTRRKNNSMNTDRIEAILNSMIRFAVAGSIIAGD
jgi:hypothetical protein